MDEGLQKTVSSVASWEGLKQFEENAKQKGRLTNELEAALRYRSTELAILYIEQRTGLQLSSLTPAERRIVEAVGEYVGLMRAKKKYPGRTLDQLKHRNLLGAVEVAVAKIRPTRGYETLVEADLEDLAYEQIVVDHPEEFTPRALWFSRKTLGLPNRWPEAPAEADGKTQQHTDRMLVWFAKRAAEGKGFIAPFTNSDAASAQHFDKPAKSGRAVGNIQSRIDFACYELGLPPLGLTATAPFAAAWQDQGRSWAFPIVGMARAARERVWVSDEFERIVKATRELPAKSKVIWETTVTTAEAKLKVWAANFGSLEVGADRPMPTAKILPNDDWIRDELILALDLYLRHRQSPPGKHSPEILELSAILVRLGEILDAQRNSTYRNPNGVYMKIMNFRRFDPQYTAGGKVGLGRGSKQEEVVWNEFADCPERLQEIATAICASIKSQQVPQGSWTDEEDEQTATEGRVLTRLHRTRERDPKIAKRKKDKVLRETGKLACETCGVDAVQKYGEIADGVMSLS